MFPKWDVYVTVSHTTVHARQDMQCKKISISRNSFRSILSEKKIIKKIITSL